MTYPEALQYLDSFANYEKKDSYDYKGSFSIDRMKALASTLGNPQDEIKSIHIAGTKGKGSTAAIIYSILKEAGFKVGLYTSPHLVSFRERIRINDSMISEDDIVNILERIDRALAGFKDDPPSFFEIYTALCFVYFKEKKVDFAVYETGLGGRLDATNIVHPLVSVITPISYEHTDKLGSTLREIAAEKGGIIKDDSVCVLAPQEPEALRALEKICNEKKTKLIHVGKEINYKEFKADAESEEFSVFGVFGEYPRLLTRLLGSHQVVNSATAIGAIEALRFSGITIPMEAVRKGIESARWPGRLEIVGRKPLVILDGAQNRASALALANAVKKIFKHKNLILVLGVSKDKDVKGILDELLPISDFVVLTKSKVIERALEPVKIREFIGEDKKVLLTSGIEEALSKVKELAKPEDLILITGSLFLVGEARDIYVKA
ncbi:MAG: folylpolyglutamate synthase/dihydrofolate synthase family protein [Candidatus Omnitrophota bacterium]|nr:folylpolyglutamate synthase/dihydrofolate synthase family protein [Candidatus Omnitrophota bacterium]